MYALYYDGKLIGFITDPTPYGRIEDICDMLSPDEGLCDARLVPGTIETDEDE